MTLDLTTVTKYDLPYRNLVLTGFLGVGKSTVARTIAKRLGTEMFDASEDIEVRELMSIAKIRELYGESRLKALEHEACRRAALMRRAVLVVPGAALLESRNYELLTQTGQVVVLTCEIGEALRRLHISGAQRFRDVKIRERMLARLRREYAVVNDIRLLQLNTTHMTVEEESELLMKLWFTGEPEGTQFRYGPPAPLRPPKKQTLGLSPGQPSLET